MGVSAIVLWFVALFTICTSDQWLMEGEFITEAEARHRDLYLESTNTTTSVSASLRVSLSASPGYLINCVLAAALHMNGDVSLLEGGVGFDSATLAYSTANGKSDLLFVLIEAHAEAARIQELLLLGEVPVVAESSRLTIVHDRFEGGWKSPMRGESGIRRVKSTNGTTRS